MTRAGDLLLVPKEPDTVEAISMADGESKWNVTLGAPARGPATIGRDNAVAIFSLGNGSLAGVSLSDGKILWTVGDLGTLSPAVASGDRVIVGSTDQASKRLFAFNAKSGAESWRLTAGDVVGVAAADALVYVVSRDNVVKAVSRDSGNQRWLKTMTTRPSLPPRVIDHQVLVVGISPLLALFDARTGMTAGTYSFAGEFEGAILEGEPILAAGGPDGSGPRVILITRDGRVLALRPGALKTHTDSGTGPGEKSSPPEQTPAKPDSTIDR
jgi:outer membrane protein assembly factor BamB